MAVVCVPIAKNDISVMSPNIRAVKPMLPIPDQYIYMIRH